MTDCTDIELQLMFHTLGYSFTPRWNDTIGGYRNDFYTHENTTDYPIIQELISKGYMVCNGGTDWSGDGKYYSCTDKAKKLVVSIWSKKKKENKPSRSKRRYQAYLYMSDCFDSFGEFLKWLTPSGDRKKYPSLYEEYYKDLARFKKEWDI